jgi:hypothetical protein
MPAKTKSTRKVVRKTGTRKVSNTKKRSTTKRKKSVLSRLLRDNKGSINSAKIKKTKFSKNRLTPLAVTAVVVVAGLSVFAFSLASTTISASINGISGGGSTTSPITISATAHNITPISIAFYLDGNHFSTKTTAPYCMNGGSGNTCWPYTIKAGPHVIKIIMSYRISTGSRHHQRMTSETYTTSDSFTVTAPSSPTTGTTGSGSTSTGTGTGTTSTDTGTTTTTGSGSGSTGGSTSTGSGSTSTGTGTTSTDTGTTTTTTTTSTSLAAPAGYSSSQLIFDDQFKGTTLNTNNWNTFITSKAANGYPWNTNGLPSGDSSESGVGGFGSDYCSPSQVSVNNGANITMVPDTSESGYSYKSGCLTSYGKFQLTNGYVQFKVKMPPGASTGGWPAIWFLPGPGGKAGDRGEIDLFEGGFLPSDVNLASNVPDDQVFASHYNGPTNGWQAAAYNTGVDMSAGYHTYGMEYIPGVSIKTFFDGHMVADFTTDINTDPYEIIINNSQANSTASGWHSSGTAPNPSVMSIAEVQAYN